jgi:hypothetical protein
MSTDSPLTVAEWREFLPDYTLDFPSPPFPLDPETDRSAQLMPSDAQREAGRLGHGPAGEAAILAAEERLAVRLPPTYRNFLLTSDGWSGDGDLDLLKVNEIDWFAEREPELIEAWSPPVVEYFTEELEVLKRCLLISNRDGGGYWLLHADSVAENGEWDAYEWRPDEGSGPEPYDNFAELVASAGQDNS